MLLASVGSVLLSCASALSMCLSIVFLIFPILYFYGWWKTGRMPEIGPALGAFLLGRIALVFLGLVLAVVFAVGLALLSMAGLIDPPSRSQASQLSVGQMWAIFIGMSVFSMLYLVIAARVCGWIYDLICRRREGFDVAMFDLGVPFGLSLLLGFVSTLMYTIAGPPGGGYTADSDSPFMNTASTMQPGGGPGLPGGGGMPAGGMPGTGGMEPGRDGMGMGPGRDEFRGGLPGGMMPGRPGRRFPGGEEMPEGAPGAGEFPSGPDDFLPGRRPEEMPEGPGGPERMPGIGGLPGGIEGPGGPGPGLPGIPGRPGRLPPPGTFPGPRPGGSTGRLPPTPGLPGGVPRTGGFSGGLGGLNKPGQSGTAQNQGASQPVPETLLEKAQYLLRKGEARNAWQYAWAAYLMEEEPILEDAVKWCSTLDRLVLGMPRIGVAVFNGGGVTLPVRGNGRHPLAPLATALPDVAAALTTAAETFGNHVVEMPWLGYVGTTIGGDHVTTVARAHHVDLMFVVHLTRKRRGRRYDLQLQFQLYEPGKSQPVWKSRIIRSSQYLSLKARGTDLLQELAQELAAQLDQRYRLSTRPTILGSDAQGFARRIVESAHISSVEKLATLKYLARQNLLSAEQARQMARKITVTEVDVLKPNDDLESWLKGRLPPVR